jgi:hypothetical protein
MPQGMPFISVFRGTNAGLLTQMEWGVTNIEKEREQERMVDKNKWLCIRKKKNKW